MDAIILDLFKLWGPPTSLAVLMWVMLQKSEKREEKKDLRIQLLENLLTESYSERIEAANQIASAMHDNATALNGLRQELRSNGRILNG